MTREQLAKILMEISAVEGGGVFQEEDGTLSFNGVNQKTYNAYRNGKGLPNQDVRNITVEETLNLLDEEFVKRNGIEKLPEEFIPIVVDTSFNSGPGNAAKLVQRTVGADEDGIIGPKTLKAINEFEGNFIESFSEARMNFILDSQSPSVVNNRAGLIDRVESVRQRELEKQSGDGVTVNKASGDVIAKGEDNG